MNYKISKALSSNFKLSLTRTMNRGKVDTLRSYDELVENAN